MGRVLPDRISKYVKNHLERERRHRWRSISSLTIRMVRAKLAVRLARCGALRAMNGQSNGYRYDYYGPLSAGRDGRAMGCREVLS